jgi:hypothetical protein
MHNAKITSDEVKSFYAARASIEEEYSKKLLALARKPLGSCEAGSLRSSLDVVRGEVDTMGKAHQNIGVQIRSELEEPLQAFAGALKERRKIVQTGIEKLLKTKTGQTNTVNKTRDRYEQDCLRIKGYLAQGHMVMGQEERKNKAKLEKTQIQVSTSSADYETAVKALEETTGRWNREWKAACDKFQDLEEERLDFMKSSLWSFANITSTVCVTDDASCEKIRLALEQCEVEKDICSFIRERGTGQEIPDPPKRLNFCRGDVYETQSEASDDEGYSVAQFPRSANPSYRSSSPNPSTRSAAPSTEPTIHQVVSTSNLNTPTKRDNSLTPQQLTPSETRQQELPYRGQPQISAEPPIQTARQQLPPQQGHAQIGYVEQRQNQIQYHPQDPRQNSRQSQHGAMNLYQMGAQSDVSSANSPSRPVSRETTSDVSHATSISSFDDGSQLSKPQYSSSPVKYTADDRSPISETDKQTPKRKSGFFQNHSPFRRKSRSEKESRKSQSSPGSQNNAHRNHAMLTGGPDLRSLSPEPVQPGASFQLNVGNNVFDVAHPDGKKQQPVSSAPKEDLSNDPIAQALAELNSTRLSSQRVSIDQYSGMKSPGPTAQLDPPSFASNSSAAAAGKRGTPPPQYDVAMKRLDLPQPAFTSASMQKTSRRYQEQTQNMLNSSANSGNERFSPGRGAGTQRGSGSSSAMGYRTTSPSSYHSDHRSQDGSRPRSSRGDQRPSSGMSQNRPDPRDMRRSASPAPGYHRGGHDDRSMQVAMSPGEQQQMYGGSQRGRQGPSQSRPTSYYGNSGQPVSHGGSNGYEMAIEPHQGDNHVRSKSMVADPRRQYTGTGNPILYYGKCRFEPYFSASPETYS